MSVLADALSRSSQILGSEWTLCQEVCRELFRKWPVTVDLFATSLNNRLPVYYSPVVDPQAAGVDTMLQTWDRFLAYAFPPFGLIPRLLAKVHQSRGLELTLVAPFRSLKPWFPDLRELLVEVPLRLPHRRDLLRQPHFHHFHHNLRALQLTGFRIASDPRGPLDSLLQWLTNLPGAAAPLPGATTSLSGWHTVLGAIATVALFPLLPFLRSRIFFYIFVVLFICLTHPLPLIVLCLVLLFASFFLTSPLTLSSMTFFAPSA